MVEKIKKPTSGERIAAFMDAQQVKPQKLWIEVWFVPCDGGFTWRASSDMTYTENKDTRELWETFHVLEGKNYHVTICSHWYFDIQLAIWIADDIVKGRTIEHRLFVE
jgi:hypothetical protein